MVVISRVAGWLLAMNIAQRLFPKREEKLQISYVATTILMFCVSIMLVGPGVPQYLRGRGFLFTYSKGPLYHRCLLQAPTIFDAPSCFF
jgi:hypothetical protein